MLVGTQEEILNIAYSPDGNLLLISDKVASQSSDYFHFSVFNTCIWTQNESLRLIDARKTTSSSGSMRILAEINFGTTYWVRCRKSRLTDTTKSERPFPFRQITFFLRCETR